MELTYKLGSAQGRMIDANHVFSALNYLENGIQEHYQNRSVGDDDHITLKVGGLTMGMNAQSIASQLKTPYQSRQDRLENDRKEAADRCYANYDFGDNIVADANGWERVIGGNSWKRIVYFENEDGDSTRSEFQISFKEGSAEIEDVDYS